MTSLTLCVEQGALDFSGAPRPPPLEQALLGGHVEVGEVSPRNFKAYDPFFGEGNGDPLDFSSGTQELSGSLCKELLETHWISPLVSLGRIGGCARALFFSVEIP